MIHTDTLVIEVTRRCNYKCMHCLRGDAMQMDITKEVLEEIARNVDPYSVTFTGGEPALNIQAMRYYMEQAKKYGTVPNSFYVVTNGSVNQEELALFSLQMYALADDKEGCGLALSMDPYHGYPDDKSAIFDGLAFFSREKMHPMDMKDEDWILKSGRAVDNGLEGRGNSYPESWEEVHADLLYGEWYLNDQVLYVSSNGKVTFNCDMSYEEIDETEFGTVFELEENLKKQFREANAA